MKDLIEKIIGLRNNDGTFSSISYNKALDDILSLIIDESSKPFNPAECGFKVDDKERYYKITSSLVFIIEKDKDENSFILQTLEKNHYFDENNLTKLLEEGNSLMYKYFKAPNHRQGEELLRNLGKID